MVTDGKGARFGEQLASYDFELGPIHINVFVPKVRLVLKSLVTRIIKIDSV